MAEALYRKYRPQIFEDVVGQEHIERTIKNAIDQDKVSHAYLFCGPRGTGKTTTARLLAKALLCECGPTPEPDGTCDDCRMIAAGEHPDVYELDAASRTGVENVREEIIGRVQFAPTRGRYKIYIIDEVHMLSTAAFNALLKTLEEPPSHVVFVLATTDPQKVPETIHSRCQRFDFRRISAEAMVSRLGAICVAEDVEFEGEALDLVAHRAEGGMRNALTSLEQLIAFGEGKVTLEVAERLLGGVDSNDLADIVRAVGQRDAAACFRWTAEFVETGADLAQFTRNLSEHVRNLYVASLAGADEALDVGDAERRQLEAELPLFGPDRLARLLGVLGDLSSELKTSTNPRLSFEIALTRMVRPDSDLTLESLAERLEALESRSAAPAPATATASSAPAVVPAAAPAPAPAAAALGVSEGFGAASAPVAPSPAPAMVAPSAAVAPAPAAVTPAAASAAPAPMAAPTSVPAAAPSTAGRTSRAVDAAASVSASAVAPQPSVVAAPSVAGQASSADARSRSQAPRTASAAAPSPQLAAGLQNPAALQRMWQAALATLKKSKAAYGVLFLNTKALYDAGKNLLVIEFPAENSFAYKAVQKADVQDAVSAALAQACGEPLSFAYTQANAPSATVHPSMAAPAAAGVVTPPAADRANPIANAPSSVKSSTSAPAPSMAAPTAAGVVTPPAADRATPIANASAPAPITSAPAPAPIASAPESFAGASVPQPDPVPLDAYDAVPYDDEPVPYDDFDVPPSDASAPEPAPAPVPAPASKQAADPVVPAGPRPMLAPKHPGPPRPPRPAVLPDGGDPLAPLASLASISAAAKPAATSAPSPVAATPAKAPASASPATPPAVATPPASASSPAASPVPVPSPAPVAATAPAAAQPSDPADSALSADDLQAMLRAGFGDGVIVEEVRE